jgi:hypothetical protein
VKNLLCLGVFSLLACLPATAASSVPLRVHCGGTSYTDTKGNVWQADFGFKEGKSLTNPGAITGTPDPAIFSTYHWDPGTYTFQIPNGNYQVNLYFVEGTPNYEKVGARLFNVSVQGSVAFPSLDVFSEAGGADTALIKSATATVSNGTLTLAFGYIVGEPEVSGIEILPANQAVSGPTLTLSFKYPDGTPVIGSLNYSVASSLLSFKGSQALVNGFAEADLFANPSAMGISAQFTVTLSLTDTSGHTLWQMNLGMNPAQVNLAAVQTSALNVVVQKL